jgi:small-conductance mechanosensitive channel
MHLQDGPQLDLSGQVARVKEKTRPWKAIIALLLAIASAIASEWARRTLSQHFEAWQVVAASCTVAFLVFGIIATIGLSGKARSTLEPRMGSAHAAVVWYGLLLVGGFTTLVLTLVLFGVPVGQLITASALTSVFIGIAAQQALSNIFAGMVLLLARPFKVGDAIQLRSGAINGPVEGVVTEIGISYTRLDTGASVMSVPNAQVLNSAVAPVPPDSAMAPAPPDSAVAPAPPDSAVAPAPLDSAMAPAPPNPAMAPAPPNPAVAPAPPSPASE